MGVEKHRRDGLDRQAALLGDDPYRFDRRPGPRIVGQRLTAHRHHGDRGTRHDSLAGIGAQRRARVPFSEVGHHLGTAENIQLDQVGRMKFQALDIDARVQRLVAGKADLGDHLGMQPGRQIPDAIALGHDGRRPVEVVTRAEKMQPGTFAARRRPAGTSTTSVGSEAGVPWWRLVSLASIGSYSPANSGSDSSESRRTARSGHESSPAW